MDQLGFEQDPVGPEGTFPLSGACWTKVLAGRGIPLLITRVNDPSKL